MSNTPPASALFVSLTDAERAALGAKYLGPALEALEQEQAEWEHWASCRTCGANEYCGDYVRLHREACDLRRYVLQSLWKEIESREAGPAEPEA